MQCMLGSQKNYKNVEIDFSKQERKKENLRSRDHKSKQMLAENKGNWWSAQAQAACLRKNQPWRNGKFCANFGSDDVWITWGEKSRSFAEKRIENTRDERGGRTKPYGSSRTRSCGEATNSPPSNRDFLLE